MNEGWQPIATAPKDGTHILACNAGKPYDDTWSFNQAPPAVVHWWGFPEDVAGFYLSSAIGEQMKPYEYTHWRPLGAEPREELATMICAKCGLDRLRSPCAQMTCAIMGVAEVKCWKCGIDHDTGACRPQPRWYTGEQES